MKPTVLVCDDEELIRWSLCQHLEEAGYHAVQAQNGETGIAAVDEHAPQAMLLDLKMPDMSGLEVLRRLRAGGYDLPVIVITAHGGIDTAVEATRLGAAGYISKPFDLREVTVALEKALEAERLRREVHFLRQRNRGGYGAFIGESPTLAGLFETLSRLESIDAPTILISGESGSGKDVLCRAIHTRGPRKNGPFVDIDCAALPETLIESELFGHEKGAFTDAHARKSGLLEVASGGVVFLDEIGEIPLGTQAKLLRALENRTFKRVGGVATLRLDAALVAATNRDLHAEVEAGRFRQDLYFRLAVVPIHLPPLRERVSDIPLLVEHFLEQFKLRLGREIKGLSGEALALLQGYSWPGNVRELRNVLERATILANNGAVLQADDLPSQIRFAGHEDAGPFQLPEGGVDLLAVERSLIQQALDRTSGNQSAAARLLGLTRYQLRYRMEKFDL